MSVRNLRTLVIDDSEDDTLLLKHALNHEDCDVTMQRVDTAQEMKRALENEVWDVVISDYMIPGFGGMQALELFKSFHLDIPFILVSGKITEEMAVDALFAGAQDFVSKNNYSRLIPAIKRGRERVAIIAEKEKVYKDLVQSEKEVKALIEYSPVPMILCVIEPECRITMVNAKFTELFGYVKDDVVDLEHWWSLAYPDEKYRQTVEEQWQDYVVELKNKGVAEGIETSITCKNGNMRFVRMSMAEAGEKRIVTFEDFTVRKDAEERLRQTLKDTVKVMASTVEMRDPYTAGHQKRVASLAKAISKKIGLSDDRIEGLLLASQIHDIGKIKVPAEILSKPTHLSDIEFELVKTHAEAGYQLLKEIDFPWPIATIIRQHHEKLDGSGYPLGIKKEKILMESQILTVADIVEAMASHRPYRPALGTEVAMKEILEEKGVKLDSVIVDACVELFNEGFEFSENESK